MDATNTSFPSGFILQKDVYTTYLLYAYDQFPIRKLSKVLPFRPPTGRIPKDPSNCLIIVRQNGFISYNMESEYLFYAKNSFKPKKLRHRKLKFPIPKSRLPPLSAADFYGKLRDRNIKIMYMDDDFNITSKYGKKFFYTFKEHFLSNNNKKNKIDKNNMINMNKEKIRKQKYDKYFDFSFHSRLNNNIFNDKMNLFEKKKIVSQTRITSSHKKIYAKDNTFPTQIDFNLLNGTNKLINRAQTANVRSHIRNSNSTKQKTNS